MIKVESSKFYGSNRVTYKPFEWCKFEWLRKILMAITGEKDYDKIEFVKLVIVMDGNYSKVRLDDVIIDNEKNKWKILWKQGSHAMIQSEGPIEVEKYKDIINIKGRRIAVLSKNYLMR